MDRNLTKLFLFVGLTAGFLARPVLAQHYSDILDLRIDAPYFSPNGDGIQDKIYFTPVLVSDWDISRWRLEIEDLKGKSVQKFNGPGFSTLIEWDGMDRKGKGLPEGEYQGVLWVWGPGFKLKSAPKSIWIDNTPPTCELKIDTTTSTKGPTTFLTKAFDNNAIDRWQLQILDLTGHTVFVQWSTGSLTQVVWDGVNQTSHISVPKGTYRGVFEVWDRAGNGSNPASVDFNVAVSDKDEVKGLIKKIKTIHTSMGLLIPLSSRDLFLPIKGKPILSKKSYGMLNEAALLINAYPDAQVRLDGYSARYRQGAKDRDLSSLTAWDIYSYLVKQVNVKASRLTVRGRGRVSPEDRISVKPPPLKDGVEIILLGPGPW